MKPICGIFSFALVLSPIWPLFTPACADDTVYKCIKLSGAAVCGWSWGGALPCPRGLRGEWVRECVATGGKMLDALGTVEHRSAFDVDREPQR
jgi:hypothetical protein